MFISMNRRIFFRTAVRLTPSFVIPIFSSRDENDLDMLNTPAPPTPKSGFERIKKMYTKNEFDEHSVELHNVVQSSLCGFFFGACLGGLFKSRDAYLYFIENNQATIFKSTIEAKKQLQNHVTVAFAKGAYHWGWRVGIFTAMFSLVTTTISVYRNDSSILEYVTAGALTGAIYKANLGGAAMLVGAGLGATLSLVGGLAILGILKMTGVSMNDIRRALYTIKEARKDQYEQAKEKSATEKHDDLTRHHDKFVEEKGVKRIEEIQ